jgi:3-oxoacyl-[acyl-carrier-protein] synthase-1
MTPLRIVAYTATSALGRGKAAMVEALGARRSALRPLTGSLIADLPDRGGLETWVGTVDGLEGALPGQWADWDCRSNRLAWAALACDGFLPAVDAAIARYGSERVAVVMGTSTASIASTEQAYQESAAVLGLPLALRPSRLHALHSLAEFVSLALGIKGPVLTLSTACSSSAKAFASAERLLRLGLVDAAVVGGVDTLCLHSLYGFHALQLLAQQPCRPFDSRRQGISLGEAAGFALIERGAGALSLLGYGESSDAHHLSAPRPDGLGVRRALDEALARSQLTRGDVDYIHLHGTATPQNDEVEAKVIGEFFGDQVPASSTKGMTGHTLGAAGILGAVFSILALEHSTMPATVNTVEPDPRLALRLLLEPVKADLRVVLCNAFGFAGSNCVLALGRQRDLASV